VGVANDEIGLQRHHTTVLLTPAPRGISTLVCIGFLGFGARGIRRSGCLGFLRPWVQVMRLGIWDLIGFRADRGLTCMGRHFELRCGQWQGRE
jgi:hypothetical protein